MNHSILDLNAERLGKAETRFWSKVEKTEGCWIWKGTMRNDGYGNFGVRLTEKIRLTLLAHRTSYELSEGRIPEDKETDYLCRNRACVNPEHLEAVSRSENQLRGQGASAFNARKTHCPHGHLLRDRNLSSYKLLRFGWRECQICRTTLQRERRLKRRMDALQTA